MIEHTPIPWHVTESIDIRRCPDSFICTCNGYSDGSAIWFEQDQANAEFIVRACNSHKDLVTACKAMLGGLGIHGPCEENSCPSCTAAYKMGVAALEKANSM